MSSSSIYDQVVAISKQVDSIITNYVYPRILTAAKSNKNEVKINKKIMTEDVINRLKFIDSRWKIQETRVCVKDCDFGCTCSWDYVRISWD